MTDIHIATIQKNTRGEIRVTLSEFKGNKLLNMRTWYQPSGEGDMRPGNSGLAFKVTQLADFRDAFARATEEAVRIRWLQPEDVT